MHGLEQLNVLPIQRVYVLHMSLIIKDNYFPLCDWFLCKAGIAVCRRSMKWNLYDN